MMKNSVKRILFTILTICITVMSGCGGKAQTSQTTETPSKVVSNSEKAYRVYVVDEKGDPVEGAKVQFCSDTRCTFENTDANGIATFEEEPGVYTVHVLKAPKGYINNPEEFTTLDTYSDIRISLKKE